MKANFENGYSCGNDYSRTCKPNLRKDPNTVSFILYSKCILNIFRLFQVKICTSFLALID